MTQFVGGKLIPLVNIYQEIQNSRGRETNEELDIIFPPYIVDRCILRSLEMKSVGYLKSFLIRCPRNIARYFYLESVTSLAPVIRSCIVSNLLGYAMLYRSTECLSLLLEQGGDPFQSSYFIECASVGSTAPKKFILYESPAIILLSGSIQEETKAEAFELLRTLRSHDVELHHPVALRRQQIDPTSENNTVTLKFSDTWECLEKEIEKRGGPEMARNKAILKEFKTVYRANKFENLESASGSRS